VQALKLGVQRLERSRDLGLREARRDVLRAIPIEGVEMQQEGRSGLAL